MSDTEQLFSRPHRWIHWIMAAIIFIMLIGGQQFGTEMADADRQFSLTGHSSLGAIIIVLLTIRIIMRLTGASGRPVHDIAPWQDSLSKAVQLATYALLIYLPITGILLARNHALPVEVFGAINISTPDQTAFDALRPWHAYATKALALLLLAHIGGALMHKFVYRDGVMRSMNPFARG